MHVKFFCRMLSPKLCCRSVLSRSCSYKYTRSNHVYATWALRTSPPHIPREHQSASASLVNPPRTSSLIVGIKSSSSPVFLPFLLPKVPFRYLDHERTYRRPSLCPCYPDRSVLRIPHIRLLFA